MSRSLFEAYLIAEDANGNRLSGAELFCYTAGTTTSVTMYADEGRTTAHPTPLVADAGGVFPQQYLPPGVYDFEIRTAAGALVRREYNVRQEGGQAGDITPESYGATGNGSTDDTAAFQSAIDALPASGGDIWLRSDDYAVTQSSLTVGSKNVRWRSAKSRINGAVNYGLPGIQDTYDETLPRRVFRNDNGAETDTTWMWEIHREADYNGGSGGVLHYAARVSVNIGANVGSSGNRKAEKAISLRVDNASDHANGVALFTAAFANAQGAVWATESTTHSTVVPATYAHRNAEFNIHGTGVDANDLRWVVEAVAHSPDGVTYAGAGVNTIHAGFQATPSTADFDFGFTADTRSGSGEFLDAAFHAYTTGDLFNGTDPTGAGIMRVGSLLNAGTISQWLGRGRNTASADLTYTEIRSRISDGTAGAEDGVLELFVESGGTLTEVFQLAGGAASPVSMMVSGSLKQVTEGAPDSGGSGFRCLRVPN